MFHAEQNKRLRYSFSGGVFVFCLLFPDCSQSIKNTNFVNSVNSLIYSVLIVPEPPRELSCFYCSRTCLGTIGNYTV